MTAKLKKSSGFSGGRPIGLGMAAIVLLCIPGRVMGAYSPGAAITGKIQKKTGTHSGNWAHIDDTAEWIEVEVYDCVDKDNCDGVEIDWNYYLISKFLPGQKGYFSPEWHASESRWYATGTGVSSVQAELTDQENLPHSDADDKPNTTITLGQDPVLPETFCAGFKVGVRADWSGYQSGNSGIVWEDGDDYVWPATPQELDKNILAQSKGDTSPGEDEVHDYWYACFQCKTSPAEAVPIGNVQADLTLNLDFDWISDLHDSDVWDEAGDSLSLSFGFSVFGVGGGFTYTWSIVDHQESCTSGDWSYTTNDGLGSNRSGSGLFKYQSGDYWELDLPATEIDSAQGRRSVPAKTWEKGDQVKGQYDVSAATYVRSDESSMYDWCDNSLHIRYPRLKVENVGYSP